MDFKTLKKTGLYSIFSEIGKGMYTPQGNFYWADKAKREAEIDATLGTACGFDTDFINSDTPNHSLEKVDGTKIPHYSDSKIVTFFLPILFNTLINLKPDDIFSYAPILGLPNFRNAWKDWILYKLEHYYSIDSNLLSLPIVVPGVTSALYFLAKLFLSPGETIITADKRWENYDHIFTSALKIKTASFRQFENGKVIFDNIEKQLIKISKKQKHLVLLLNLPNNPTGFMPTQKEISELKNFLLETVKILKQKLIIIFDDAYEGFVYSNNAQKYSCFGSFVNLHPDILPIKLDGTSKEFLLYGGRIACITIGLNTKWGNIKSVQSEIEDKIGGMIRGSVSNSPRIIQNAVSNVLNNNLNTFLIEQKNIVHIMSERCNILRTHLEEKLKDVPDVVQFDPFNSGYFCLLNLKQSNAVDIAERLVSDYKIGVVPMVNKQDNLNALRVAFCGIVKEKIPDSVERLTNCIISSEMKKAG